MPVPPRLRRLLAAALPAVLAVSFAACDHATYPNSVFTNHTEFNRSVGGLFDILFLLGGIVFVFVEAILLYAIWKYRRRSEDDRPEHVHGNTTLEILWTAIPAVILIFIAIPTVRVIFETQAKAKSDALQVEVIGHQWWWEFRYPQYGITTAGELYLPIGRTVNFALKTADVLHSFSIPRLGGKRDLISNHTNYLWFTPDSVQETAFNGMCAEYCGASHANMRFKTFTVSPANFEAWAKNQQRPAAMGAEVPAVGAAAAAAAPGAPADPSARQAAQVAAQAGGQATGPTGVAAAMGPQMAQAPAAAADPAHAGHSAMGGTGVQQAGFTAFPRERMPDATIPKTPIPAAMGSWDESVKGDAQRGRDFMAKFGGGCAGCHAISGIPTMVGQLGPNLTHVATRTTIAGGLYPNDTKHLSLWIKNARYMKPGSYMPTLGAFQRDPITKKTVPQTGLSDQQIADIVAYLQALK